MPMKKGSTKKPAAPAKKAPTGKKQRGGPVEMPMRRPGAY